MRIILILLIGLTIFGCGEDRRQRESFEIKRIESKRKSDSILSVELQKAKIPYKKNGINEELLEKYLTKNLYQKYIFSDKKAYRHYSKKNVYKIVRNEDGYQLRQYQTNWEYYDYRDYIFKEDAEKEKDRRLNEARKNYNTNVYALWKIKSEKDSLK